VSFCPAIEDTLANLRVLSNSEDPIELSAISSFLKKDDPVFEEIRAIAVPDTAKPYGRRVLLQTDDLEVMVAEWTPGMSCAPHDHGGSRGVVRVLQGSSRHTIWGVTPDGLSNLQEERVSAGNTMLCGRDLVHSMMDDGADEPLITLHIYTRSIDHMVVYDAEAGETLVVEGACGAWVPHDAPEMIRCKKTGFHHPHTMR
jgi:predicted metal-dependent enzyme (double-stranded beta helix superfamily)